MDMIRNVILGLVALVCGLAFGGCSDVDYTVENPTFKGFDYQVRKRGEGSATVRGEILPGDSVRVYCVRNSPGRLCGLIHGYVLLRSTFVYADAPAVTTEMVKQVRDDGGENCFAEFAIPFSDEGKVLTRVEYRVAATLGFQTFGGVKSDLDPKQSVNVPPYFGTFVLLDLTVSSGGRISTVPKGRLSESEMDYNPDGSLKTDENGNVVIITKPLDNSLLTLIYRKEL